MEDAIPDIDMVFDIQKAIKLLEDMTFHESVNDQAESMRRPMIALLTVLKDIKDYNFNVADTETFIKFSGSMLGLSCMRPAGQ